MSGIRETLEAYDRLRALREEKGEKTWPELIPVFLLVTTQEIDLAEPDRRRKAFDEVVATLSEGEGWARCQSALIWSGMKDQPSFDDAGPPLNAEWVVDADSSIRLGPDPSGIARLVGRKHVELPDDDAVPEGALRCLRQRVEVLAHRRIHRQGHQKLVYHVYWGAGPDEPWHAMRRIADRFAGFANGGNE